LTVFGGLPASANAPLISVNPRKPAFWPYWYNGNYATRHAFAKGISNAYPCRQLGYTYDWDTSNPSHQGLSEFVIPCSVLAPAQGVTVPIEVESIRKLEQQGQGDWVATGWEEADAVTWAT
jgi:hypothetical protein